MEKSRKPYPLSMKMNSWALHPARRGLFGYLGMEYAVLWVISRLVMNICLKNLHQFINVANFGATKI
jgi:hypothetical protein